MKSKLLTDKKAKAVKPEPGQKFARDVPDGGVPGLSLVIHPSGKKTWSWRYRYQGKQKRITLGRYGLSPTETLAAARALAKEKLAMLERGEDPGAKPETEPEPEVKQPDLVEDVAEEWLKRQVRNQERQWKETERIINKEVISRWGDLPIQEVTKPDILKALDEIVDRGASVMANRTRGVLLRFFRWAENRGYVEESPMLKVDKPGPDHRERERTLTADELAEVWEATGNLGYPYGPFYRLLILSAQRLREVAHMRRDQLDLDEGTWTLQSADTKAKRIHDVPLSTSAVEIIESMPVWEGPYMLTTDSGKKPIGGFSKGKKRLDEEIARLRAERGITEKMKLWTVHDLRRTAATGMAENNTAPHVLAAILNHSPGKIQGITAIYNRHRYSTERRQALEAWAQHVLELAKPKAAKAVRVGA